MGQVTQFCSTTWMRQSRYLFKRKQYFSIFMVNKITSTNVKPNMEKYSFKKLVYENCSVMSNSLGSHGLPGSSVHGTLQARTLEWVDVPFSRGSSQSRDQTQVSHIAGGFFTV